MKEIVPTLSIEEFQFAMQAADAAYTGALPLDPEAVMGPRIECPDGSIVRFTDTPFNRALHAMGKVFEGEPDKRQAMITRFLILEPLTMRREFRKFIRNGEIRRELLEAIVGMPLTMKECTKTRPLAKRLLAETKRRMGER